MDYHYQEAQLRAIAEECREFEHIINAMGYGYSLLNVSAESFSRRCPDCIHWASSACDIFQREITRWE